MLEDLDPKLKQELDASYDEVKASIIDGFSFGKNNLKRLPENMSLLTDGTIVFNKKNKGETAPASIDDLFKLIDTVFQIAARNNDVKWLIEDSDGQKKIRFVRYGSEDELQSPTITFKVMWGKPGAFGKGPEMNPSHKQRNPILREIVEDPERAGEEIFILSQRYDYHIELEISASTAKEADSVRRWVEVTIAQNLWYFKYSGIVEFYFSERLADTTRNLEGKSLHCRSLKYFVQTEELSWYRSQILRELYLTVNLE